MVKSKPPLAVIAGPTASGKSALALELAVRSGGAVINADSAQLYSDLPILSAAPTAADRARAEHRLYGVRDGPDPCSAAEWAALAKVEVAALHAEGRLPILAGGTGLYLRTLLNGIAPVPPIDPVVRAGVRAASTAENLAALTPLDPVAAAELDPADSTRIARALEVVRSSGTTLRHWQQQSVGGIADQVALVPVILLPPRDWLYERCNARFSQMLEDGAEAEVASLLARGLDPMLPVMRAIGVREISGLLSGEWSREAALAAGAQATRNYAKRQYTWFAHQPPPEWPRLAAPLDCAGAVADALALIDVAA
jgi:tRNA dimethylallyltransferase